MALEAILREKRAYLALEVDGLDSGSACQERSAEREQRLKGKSRVVRATREMYRKHKRDRRNARNAQDDSPGKLLNCNPLSSKRVAKLIHAGSDGYSDENGVRSQKCIAPSN